MKYIFVLLLSCILLLQSCKPKSCEDMGKHDKCLIVNNSSRNIKYNFILNYPDTIIPKNYNPKTQQTFFVAPFSEKETFPLTRKHPKDPCIEDQNYGAFWLYFYDKDTIDVLPWDTIKLTGRGILERREMNLDYLQSHDFKITYP